MTNTYSPINSDEEFERLHMHWTNALSTQTEHVQQACARTLDFEEFVTAISNKSIRVVSEVDDQGLWYRLEIHAVDGGYAGLVRVHASRLLEPERYHESMAQERLFHELRDQAIANMVPDDASELDDPDGPDAVA